MTVRQSSLIVSLIDRLTGPARNMVGAVTRLNAAAARNAAALNNVRGQLLDAAGMGYILAQSLSALIKAAIDFESSMSGLTKVMDFSSPAALKQMTKDIREMSLEIPIAASGLADIAAAAAGAGIKENELTRFTKMAAKVSTAWDTTAAQTGKDLAKLKDGLGLTLDETGSLADAINHLSNNSSAAAGEILDVVKVSAASAKQFGFTAEQTAALGTAMIGSGFNADVASTSILNVGRALTKGTSASKRQAAALKTIGLTSKGVAKSMQKDAIGTLQNVLGRINKVAPEMRAALVSDLFGDEARALGPLITNGKLLADVLGLVSDKQKYAGSASREFENASKRTEFAIQRFKNRVNDLAISIGDALLPSLNNILDTVGPIITDLSQLAQKYPGLTKGIVAATAALIGFNVAATALRFAFLWTKGSIIGMALPVMRLASNFGSAAKEAIALQRALGAMSGQKLTGFQTFTSGLRGMWFAVPGVSAIAGALGTIGAALATISAPAWLAIGVGVAAVGAAGAYLYRNWDRISSIATGVARALGEELKPVIDFLQPVLQPFADSFSAIGDGANWAWTQIKEVASWLGSLFQKDDLTRQHEMALEDSAFAVTKKIVAAFKAGGAALFNAGAEMIQSLWDGMVAKVEAMIEWVKTIPGRIKSSITTDLSGTVKGWFGYGSGSSEQPSEGDSTANVPKRAKGGPVKAGHTYMVNEKGQEFFTPGRSGVISTNEAFKAAQAGAAARQPQGGPSEVTVNVTVPATITISGVADARTAITQAGHELSRSIKQAVESSWSGE